MTTKEIVDDCRTRIGTGETSEQMIRRLHNCGFTITESIKIVRETLGITLADAKDLVSRQACWKGIVKASDALHESLVQTLEGTSKNGSPE